MLNNVKPLARASNVAFTDFEVRRVAQAPTTFDGTDETFVPDGREIPTTTLRIKHASVDSQDGILVPGNSGNLHARLKQVLGHGFEVGMLDESVERRIKQFQKRETNPRAKLE